MPPFRKPAPPSVPISPKKRRLAVVAAVILSISVFAIYREVAPMFATPVPRQPASRQPAPLPAAPRKDLPPLPAVADNAQAHTQRGNELLESGDVDGAMAEFDRAIEMGGRDPAAYLGRASVRLAKRDREGALADLTQAIDVAPNAASLHSRRGALLFMNGDLEGASKDITRSLKLDTGGAEALALSGALKMKSGNLPGALGDAERAIQLQPAKAGVAYYVRASLRIAKGELDGAIADCDEALRSDKNDALAMAMRGIAYFRQRRMDKAIQDLEASLQMNLPDWEVATVRSMLAQAKGK